MKNRYINTISILSFAALMLTVAGCQKSFEEINTNRYGVTKEMSTRDGVGLGGKIQAMMTAVTPVGTASDGTDIINGYQVAYHLNADVLSGYFSENNNWNSGNNPTTLTLNPGWLNSPFQYSYTNIFKPWMEVKNHPSTQDHPENYALAQILKISTWHKATDYFGPIPYTKAGSGLYVTPYDSQEVVYKSMLKDLEEAISILYDYGKGGAKIFALYDVVYEGNTLNWVKYANSLMLRIAMRTRYADPVLAQTYAEKAIAHPAGVISTIDEEAKVSNKLGIQFVNNIETLAGQYSEARMSVPMFAYLAGYKDPRIGKFFKPSAHPQAVDVNGATYLPYPTGLTKDQSKAPNAGEDKNLWNTSIPNIEKNTPTYWLRASEVYFLRAEGALYGWQMNGSAEDLYMQGIKTSFEENQIPTSELNSYINDINKPVEVNMSGVEGVNHIFEMRSTATTEFSGTTEEKLEKIITQKWIALFPNGMEAWSEWRRTGYPYIARPKEFRGAPIVDRDMKIRRLQYPIKTARSKDEQMVYDEAIKLLGGEDNAATRLWWDKKNFQ